MATINVKNFPGAYSQIIDKSLAATSTSRFQPGLIGIASKGPFDTPTRIATVADFISTFGQPVSGYFLATALGIIAPYTNGATVVRVGLQYRSLPGGVNYPATGASGNNYFVSSGAALVDPSLSPTGEMYVQITQPGKKSTINAQVLSVAGSYGTLVSPSTLSDDYSNGVLKFSYYENAASKAEASLDGYVYQNVSGLGTVAGTKGNFYFTLTGTPGNLAVGDLITISQSNKAPTQEVYVSAVNPLVGGSAVIEIKSTDDTERGYQALSLQDTYTAASITRMTGKTTAALVYALTAGTWSNTTTDSTNNGLHVEVSPGTAPGTKKLLVYWNSSLVEVYDNLGEFTTPAVAQPFATTINTTAPSNYITFSLLGTVIPANTVNPWNTAASDPVISSPTNTGAVGAAGAFSGGYNGEKAQASDFVGSYDPTQDVSTGIKAFEDKDNVFITTLVAPGVTSTDASSLSVHTQLRDTARAANAMALIDIPANNPTTFPDNGADSVPLNIWNAIDWVNGDGQFASRGKLNSFYLAPFFNWPTITDPITQATIVAPPTIAALRAMAFTWLNYQPWYAAAGDNQGVVSEATTVMFPRISESAKESAYIAGQNPVNIVLQQSGVVKVMGDLTMLRIPIGTTDKLTAIHNVVLVEYVVQGLAAIGRRHVFDPNDLTLLQQLTLEMTQFLDSVKNLRGIEAYELTCDSSNNNATTRNQRSAIVDLNLIPTDSVEKIYINATVLSSGAIVNAING